MKVTLDIKSLIIGVLSAALIVITMSNKPSSEQIGGKFRTEVENNMIVILNTENGDYLVAPEMRDFGKVQWVKGEFYNTFKTAKDNKKE